MTKSVQPVNDLEIHRNSLDEDCERHPSLMWEWGQKLAEARRVAKLGKNTVKLVASRLEMDIRSAPNEFGLEKATDASVKAALEGHPHYQTAVKDLIHLEYEEDLLTSFVEALRAKQQDITGLIQLHGQMYWSKPTGQPSMNQRARENAAEAAAKGLNKR